jgi:exonuclease III
MNKQWNILNWNIRGLGEKAKWLALQNKIEESQCDILCLQETKKEDIDMGFIKKLYPTNLSLCHRMVPLEGCW